MHTKNQMIAVIGCMSATGLAIGYKYRGHDRWEFHSVYALDNQNDDSSLWIEDANEDRSNPMDTLGIPARNIRIEGLYGFTTPTDAVLAHRRQQGNVR